MIPLAPCCRSPNDEETTEWASEGGHLQCLAYARQRLSVGRRRIPSTGYCRVLSNAA